MYLWDFFFFFSFHDYSYCSVCILPQPAFYSQSAFYPWSAVCSLCFTLTVCYVLLRTYLHCTAFRHYVINDLYYEMIFTISLNEIHMKYMCVETSMVKMVWLEGLMWSQFYKEYKTYWNGCQYTVRCQGTFVQNQAGLCQN